MNEVTYGPDSVLRLAQRSSEKASLNLNILILCRETYDGSHAENMGQCKIERSPTYEI
jgi:hypothetical protein